MYTYKSKIGEQVASAAFLSDSQVIFVDFECRLIEFFLLLYTIHILFWPQRLFIFTFIFAL